MFCQNIGTFMVMMSRSPRKTSGQSFATFLLIPFVGIDNELSGFLLRYQVVQVLGDSVYIVGR